MSTRHAVWVTTRMSLCRRLGAAPVRALTSLIPTTRAPTLWRPSRRTLLATPSSLRPSLTFGDESLERVPTARRSGPPDMRRRLTSSSTPPALSRTLGLLRPTKRTATAPAPMASASAVRTTRQLIKDARRRVGMEATRSWRRRRPTAITMPARVSRSRSLSATWHPQRLAAYPREIGSHWHASSRRRRDGAVP